MPILELSNLGEVACSNVGFDDFQPRRGCISVDKSMCLVALAHIFAAE